MSSRERRREPRRGEDDRESHRQMTSRDRDRERERDSRRDKNGEHRREKERERGQERGRDRGQERHDDRSRDHYKGRSSRDERGKGELSGYDHFHGRDNDRGQDHYREKDKHKRRSRSRSKDKFSNRKSQSPSPSKNKRTSGFDMAPPGGAVLPDSTLAGHLTSVAQPATGIFSTILPLANPQLSLAMMPVQAMTQQATRHARRVYVGGLPPLANEQTIAMFFSQVMSAIGGNAAGPGDAVVNVYINHEKKFAFVEMRSVEEASNAMALDGIIFEGVSVRVRRPTDYNPSLAAALGPSQPSPFLNLAVVGLASGAIGGSEGPDRIFVGGLPYYFTDGQIRELLESFGPLRGFNLVKDRESGNSKGYGFCVYQDPSVTDIACAALNGLKMGDKTLTVRRATASMDQMKPEQEFILQQAQQHIAMQKLALQTGGSTPLSGADIDHAMTSILEPPTKVVCLTEVVSIDELRNDNEYEEILEDMREESEKFGSLISLTIPRPEPTGETVPGVGKVFLEFSDTTGSARAKAALHGRKFGSNVVCASYYPEDKYSMGDYGSVVEVS